jgi:hypothetical protein
VWTVDDGLCEEDKKALKENLAEIPLVKHLTMLLKSPATSAL